MRWPISSITSMPEHLERCPACRARLTEAATCSRCGCDFSLLRQAELAAARRLAQAARLLVGGDRAAAGRQVDAALALQRSALAQAIQAFLAGAPPLHRKRHAEEGARFPAPGDEVLPPGFMTEPCSE
jgi:hypothetical protein